MEYRSVHLVDSFACVCVPLGSFLSSCVLCVCCRVVVVVWLTVVRSADLRVTFLSTKQEENTIKTTTQTNKQHTTNETRQPPTSGGGSAYLGSFFRAPVAVELSNGRPAPKTLKTQRLTDQRPTTQSAQPKDQPRQKGETSVTKGEAKPRAIDKGHSEAAYACAALAKHNTPNCNEFPFGFNFSVPFPARWSAQQPVDQTKMLR